jgi:two-component system response regulator AtoC
VTTNSLVTLGKYGVKDHRKEESTNMLAGRVLIVDDEASIPGGLRRSLESHPVEIRVATGTEAAITLLGSERFHAVLCNLGVAGGGWLKILCSLQTRGLPTPVIIMDSHPDGKVIQEYLTGGVFAFLSHPIDASSFLAVVRRALLRSGLIFKEIPSAPPDEPIRHFPFMVGTSSRMRELLRGIVKIAAADSNVCVYGESGTGKELVARAIHYSSRRANRPLIVFDCTAIPEGLMESEMFGHVKGAFTSAVGAREGIFQLADGGSLFIDEIGELSLPLQAKLLRVIQTREFRKVGGEHPIKVDVRVIAATSKDLRSMAAAGTFREDLFYRLEVVPLTLPPLRQHKEDIPLLVDHFIQRFNRTNTKQIQSVSSRTMVALLRYAWPGNIRELENCIERAAVLCDGKILDVDDLALVLRPNRGAVPPSPLTEDDAWPCDLKATCKDVERALILKTLQGVGGNRTRAAELLNISLRGLHYKIRELPPAQIPATAQAER